MSTQHVIFIPATPKMFSKHLSKCFNDLSLTTDQGWSCGLCQRPTLVYITSHPDHLAHFGAEHKCTVQSVQYTQGLDTAEAAFTFPLRNLIADTNKWKLVIWIQIYWAALCSLMCMNTQYYYILCGYIQPTNNGHTLQIQKFSSCLSFQDTLSKYSFEYFSSM